MIWYFKTKETSYYIIIPLVILSFFAIFSGYLSVEYFTDQKYFQLWTSSYIVILDNQLFHHGHSFIEYLSTELAFF